MASLASSPGTSGRDSQPAKRNYGRIVEQTWIWSVVGYSLVRFFIAWGAFSDHGANPWIFGLIDVGTAWPYGKAVAVVCKRVARSEWSRLAQPLVAAVVMFFAPYAYLWFAAGEMPAGMRMGLVICVSVLFIAASTGVIAKSRKLRREASDTVTDTDQIDLRTSAPTTELVIDLTGDDVSVERSSERTTRS